MGRSLLIQQLKDGNEKVFEQIVKSYWPRLYAFANIYVINKEAAKEIGRIHFWFFGAKGSIWKIIPA